MLKVLFVLTFHERISSQILESQVYLYSNQFAQESLLTLQSHQRFSSLLDHQVESILDPFLISLVTYELRSDHRAQEYRVLIHYRELSGSQSGLFSTQHSNHLLGIELA